MQNFAWWVSRKKQWSILVMVLMIMVVSSFLVLLTMRYFLSMLREYGSLTDYTKAYYLARGGMDVLKTQHAYRGRWYETVFAAGDIWWFWDFQCGTRCGIDWSITARFPRIDASPHPTSTTCDASTALNLSGGQSMMFALFADAHGGGVDMDVLSTGDYAGFSLPDWLNSIDLTIYGTQATWMIYLYDSTIGDFWQTQEFLAIPTILPNWGNLVRTNLLQWQTSTRGKFIIFSNPSGAAPYRFCLSSPNKNIIGQRSIIQADGRVDDIYVSLETIKTNRFPSILLQ